MYSFRWITIFQRNIILRVKVRMLTMQFDYTSRLHGKWSLRYMEGRGDNPVWANGSSEQDVGKSLFCYLYHLRNETNSGSIQTHTWTFLMWSWVNLQQHNSGQQKHWLQLWLSLWQLILGFNKRKISVGFCFDDERLYETSVDNSKHCTT